MAAGIASKIMMAVQKASTKAEKTVLKMASETESRMGSKIARCLVSS